MKKKPVQGRKGKTPKKARSNPISVANPNAAGIDLAINNDHWVAVPEHLDSRPVRSFSPLTYGQTELIQWLCQIGVTTVAMEATGVYWLSLYERLRAAGLEVIVVNPRTAKNLNRKSDISDCQWLQYLHSVGLLRGSFIPVSEVLALRTITRHRENLLKTAAMEVQHMQKALDEMNIHIHHVIDDITGVTGMAIIEAILKGEREPSQLAKFRHRNVKASEKQVAASLEGHWKEEHLFVLGQSHALWQAATQQIQTCEQMLEKLVGRFSAKLQADQIPEKIGRKSPSKNQPQGDWERTFYGVFGVNLAQTPGIGVLTILCLLSEVGPDWSAFPTAAHFASWLGLCPNNESSAGKIMRRSTKTVQNRVRNAFKMASQGLARNKSFLGTQYRRMRARNGPAAANTAMAHKLARIVWHQVRNQTAYDESFLVHLDEANEKRRRRQIERQAAAFGLKLIPIELSANNSIEQQTAA